MSEECGTVNDFTAGAVTLHVEIEKFALKEPFHITGHTMVDTDVVTVTLEKDGHVARGEASGVYYRQDDDAGGVLKQIEAVRRRIEAGINRESLQRLLPTGGARNAVDCALWDLEAKLTGRPAWQTAGLDPPRPLLTTFTVGANKPEKMAADARAYADAKAIKLKLTGDPLDADRVRAVRAARPDVWLGDRREPGIHPRVSRDADARASGDPSCNSSSSRSKSDKRRNSTASGRRFRSRPMKVRKGSLMCGA